MSHFTRISTRLMDGQALRAALEEMGHIPLPIGGGVAGFLGGTAKAEFKIAFPRSTFEMGFQPSKNGYSIVADWWGLDSVDKDGFVQELRRRYAEKATLAKLLVDGFEVDSREEFETGEVRLVFRRVIG